MKRFVIDVSGLQDFRFHRAPFNSIFASKTISVVVTIHSDCDDMSSMPADTTCG